MLVGTLRTIGCTLKQRNVILRSGSSLSGSSAPSPMPAVNPNATDPKDCHGRTAEDKARYSVRYEYKESPYALGKHRSNALELINKVPVIEVAGEMAVCDGGGGALGHPIEYISLARPDSINSCKYCGLRY